MNKYLFINQMKILIMPNISQLGAFTKTLIKGLFGTAGAIGGLKLYESFYSNEYPVITLDESAIKDFEESAIKSVERDIVSDNLLKGLNNNTDMALGKILQNYSPKIIDVSDFFVKELRKGVDKYHKYNTCNPNTAHLIDESSILNFLKMYLLHYAKICTNCFTLEAVDFDSLNINNVSNSFNKEFMQSITASTTASISKLMQNVTV